MRVCDQQHHSGDVSAVGYVLTFRCKDVSGTVGTSETVFKASGDLCAACVREVINTLDQLPLKRDARYGPPVERDAGRDSPG